MLCVYIHIYIYIYMYNNTARTDVLPRKVRFDCAGPMFYEIIRVVHLGRCMTEIYSLIFTHFNNININIIIVINIIIIIIIIFIFIIIFIIIIIIINNNNIISNIISIIIPKP